MSFFTNSYLTILTSIIFITAFASDALLQYKFGVMSTNCRRAITGFLGGIGIGFAVNEFNRMLIALLTSFT